MELSPRTEVTPGSVYGVEHEAHVGTNLLWNHNQSFACITGLRVAPSSVVENGSRLIAYMNSEEQEPK